MRSSSRRWSASHRRHSPFLSKASLAPGKKRSRAQFMLIRLFVKGRSLFSMLRTCRQASSRECSSDMSAMRSRVRTADSSA